MAKDIQKQHKVTILFACTHNAGRSYAAQTIAESLKPAYVTVISAGTEPKDRVNPHVSEALINLGYLPASHKPQKLTTEFVEGADYVITMGCSETCPIFKGKTYLDWALEDPADKPTATVLQIVKEIELKVVSLLNSIKSSTKDATQNNNSNHEIHD